MAYYYPSEQDIENLHYHYAVGYLGVHDKWYPIFLDEDFDGIVVAWQDIDKFIE